MVGNTVGIKQFHNPMNTDNDWFGTNKMISTSTLSISIFKAVSASKMFLISVSYVISFHHFHHFHYLVLKWATMSENVPLDMCAQRRFSLSILGAWLAFWIVKNAKFLCEDNKILIRQCRCAGWFKSSLGIHVRWYVFLNSGSNNY